MASLRIPVSLKVDDESKFYKDFVLGLRESKELSEFILDLLGAYFESEDVRDALDKYKEATNPYAELKRQIDRISVEHQKTMMSAAILSNFVKNKSQDYSEKVEEDSVTPSMNEFMGNTSGGVLRKMLKEAGVNDADLENKENDAHTDQGTNKESNKDTSVVHRLEHLEIVTSNIEKKLDNLTVTPSTSKSQETSDNLDDNADKNNNVALNRKNQESSSDDVKGKDNNSFNVENSGTNDNNGNNSMNNIKNLGTNISKSMVTESLPRKDKKGTAFTDDVGSSDDLVIPQSNTSNDLAISSSQEKGVKNISKGAGETSGNKGQKNKPATFNKLLKSIK